MQRTILNVSEFMGLHLASLLLLSRILNIPVYRLSDFIRHPCNHMQHMKDHGSGKTTIENLAAVLGVSERTIIRLRQEERTNYSTDLIIGLCVAMHLPPWLSRPFIQRANITVSSYGKSGYYGTILDCYYMDTIATVQEFLEKNGYHKLVLEE